MKKRFSLKGKACFKCVFRKGKKVRQKNCTFLILQCSLRNSEFCKKTDNALKIGIVVPRNFGKAYLRNRAKRIFREAFREFCITENSDYCIIVRLYKGFIDMTVEDVKKEIRDCFQKIKQTQ